MSCRKCKYFESEGDLEYWILHQWDTHGKKLENLKIQYPDANWELISELRVKQMETGQVSAEKHFGKKATRKIKIKSI